MFSKSTLYDQGTFYRAFMRDLLHSKDEVIIESPFITEKRMRTLLPIFTKLRSRNVRIVINTRNPNEHDGDYYYQALNAIWISLNRFVSSSSTLTIRVAHLLLRISRTSCVWSFFIVFISCLLFQFLVLLIAPLLLDCVVFPNLPIGHLESAES